MTWTALLLACLMCGGDPEFGFADLPRAGLPPSLRNMAPAMAPDGVSRPSRPPAAPFVDLSWPGALERLARENPDHARKAQELLQAAGPLSCEALLEQFRARPDLSEPTCVTRSLLPTDPPRRIVGFTLGETKYLSWVRSEAQ